MKLIVIILGVAWGFFLAYISRQKARVADAVTRERNRCADAIVDPEFMHCQGFRSGDRVRLAEKIRSRE